MLILIGVDGHVQSTAIRYSTPPDCYEQALLSAASKTRVRWMEGPPTSPVCFQREYPICGNPAKEHILKHPGYDKRK